MKGFFKNLLANFALIFLVNAILSALGEPDYWDSISPFLELLFLTLLLRLALLLTSKISFSYPILEYLLEFGVITAIVFGCGWLLGWKMDIWWLILLMIALIYVMVYLLDLGRTSRDITYINEQIRLRRSEMAAQNEKSSLNSISSIRNGDTDHDC